MFLITLGTILFILAKVADHYHTAYARMWDGTRIASFVHDYWRTSKALPQFLFSASMLCIWFSVRHLDVAVMLAMMLLFVCCLSLMCGIVMCIASPIMLLLGEWSFDSILYRLGDAYLKISEGWRNWKDEAADMLGMSVLTGASLASFGFLLWNMAATVLPRLESW